MTHKLLTLVIVTFCLFCGACKKQSPTTQEASEEKTVVVYTALDRSFSEPILEAFTKKTGIRVLAQYDTESTKSVGLTNRIRAEKDRPRCDVFWNNEILNTMNLKSEGLLQSCSPAEADNYDALWKDPDGCWYGFAARARVIIANTDSVPADKMPDSIYDLANPEWKGQTGIAKPLFGTTASHVACLFAMLGPEKAGQYLDSLKANEVQVQGGNKGCAESVAGGSAAFAMTDTDDAIIEQDAGKPVAIVYPDTADDGLGTLFLPNTLAVIKDAPHAKEAEALINYLLSAEVEETLANGPSAQIPLNRTSKPNPRIMGPQQIKPMKVDFAKAAEVFPEAREWVEKNFLK